MTELLTSVEIPNPLPRTIVDFYPVGDGKEKDWMGAALSMPRESNSTFAPKGGIIVPDNAVAPSAFLRAMGGFAPAEATKMAKELEEGKINEDYVTGLVPGKIKRSLGGLRRRSESFGRR